MVLLFRNAICMSVCLNMLVVCSVSIPTYVNAAHLCLGVRVICSAYVVGLFA
jgi:hypothetical protein